MENPSFVYRALKEELEKDKIPPGMIAEQDILRLRISFGIQIKC